MMHRRSSHSFCNPLTNRIAATLATLTSVVVVSGLSSSAHAYPEYVSDIPNTVNGCGTCHFSEQGGGPRNIFGDDMEDADFVWSSVCGDDSDADGQTNGQELGDPDCIWTRGASPARFDDLSNPGDATETSANPNGGASGNVDTDAGVVDDSDAGDDNGNDADAGDDNGGDNDAGDDTGNDDNGGDNGAVISCQNTNASSSSFFLGGLLVGFAALRRSRRNVSTKNIYI